MKISKENLFSVASEVKIPKEQIEALWTGLEKLGHVPESSPFTKYLLYLGALIVISAMTWFMNFGWDQFGGGGVFLIAVAYALIFTLVGSWLWGKKGLRIPGGLFITMAVCMAPLAIYGLEAYFNIWPNGAPSEYHDFYSMVAGSWIFMELGTILVGAIALRFFPFPFLTAPIFFAAWFFAMDIAPFVFGPDVSLEKRYWITLLFGLVLIAIGFVIDRRGKRDYAFWSYLFGTLAFWVGLNCIVWDKGEFALVIYLVISLMMMCLSILVRRNVLMIFGAIGVFTYLCHLTYTIFKDSVFFPFALSLIGLFIIYLGILYQRNLGWIEKNLVEKLPSGLKSFLGHRKD